MSDYDITNDEDFDTKKLDALIKGLKGELPMVKVGILGAKNARTSEKGGPSNASIGAKHEFGLDGMPVRSFLRQPLIDFMQKYLEESKAFDVEALKKILQEGTIVPWLKKIGIVAERVIADGFDSGGFGKWLPSNMEFKKNHQTLVETGQLRNAITSEVEE